MACAECNANVDDDFVQCESVCERKFHYKCLNITKAACEAINRFRCVKYICGNCEKYILKAVDDKLDKIIKQLNEGGTKSMYLEDKIVDLQKEVREMQIEMRQEMQTFTKKQGERKETFAEKVKSSNSETLLVVKPKNSEQGKKETQNDIKKNINPAEFKINKLQAISKGAIAIECQSKNAVEELKKKAIQKLGSKYEVKLPELKKPRFKILRVCEILTDDEIVNSLKAQNACLSDADLKVVARQKYKNNSDIVIEVGKVELDCILKQEKLNLMWERCKIVESIYVRKCYNCCGFNHIAKDCKNEKSCSKCSGDHGLKECNSSEVVCVNCKHANDKLNLNIDVKHRAWSKECTVMKRKFEQEKRRIIYQK